MILLNICFLCLIILGIVSVTQQHANTSHEVDITDDLLSSLDLNREEEKKLAGNKLYALRNFFRCHLLSIKVILPFANILYIHFCLRCCSNIPPQFAGLNVSLCASW